MASCSVAAILPLNAAKSDDYSFVPVSHIKEFKAQRPKRPTDYDPKKLYRYKPPNGPASSTFVYVLGLGGKSLQQPIPL